MGCPRAAHSSNLGSTFWNRIPYPFSVSYSPKQNLMHKFQHNIPHQFLEVNGCPKSQKQIPQFGPMFWDRSYGPFPTFFISIHDLKHNILKLKTQTAMDGHGCPIFGLKNYINSVSSFGTDQTVVQGLKLTETSKNT